MFERKIEERDCFINEEFFDGFGKPPITTKNKKTEKKENQEPWKMWVDVTAKVHRPQCKN